ncbi:MAG TPA: NADH-quinone oxidoreductase subunit C, partial [Marmoricola sp.]|nr:NADH-quinone oxidoreductase subunit C [Marmoricola sp.]
MTSEETERSLERTSIPLEVIGEREGMFGAHGSGDTSGYGGLKQPVMMPAPSEPPFGEWRDDIASALARGARDAGYEPWEKVVVHRGEITFFVKREHLTGIARLLRDDAALRFELCSGVSGVHYPGDEGRELHAIYHLLSMTHNRRIRLEVTCPDSDPHIPSVCSTYPTADW